MVERRRRSAPPFAPVPALAMTEPRRLRFLPYLLEFLVVVLGVTVSFGLDGWRHDRQQAKLHEQDVRSLLQDLARDEERLEQVAAHIDQGEVALGRVLTITNAFRTGELDYEGFTSQLMALETPYRYSTFYMNNSTYKSLLSNGRLQLFPEPINKNLRDYYEYVSKRLEDNNDLVDRITLRYYNEDHPWVNYRHGAEALQEQGLEAGAAEGAAAYFQGPGIREHYGQLSFLHGTLALYDRVLIHGGQVELYRQLRDELEGIVQGYASGVGR